ncbi:hypothetical protein AGMMS49574_11280 [Bacteroidia bacterium]|nr:hypothetical protein AGMMS49574_11280 [Bacteroidia bacterium]GHV05970.1 hypothetical protein FACS189416_6190 [Bacteroidia bacterium]
MQLLKKSIDSLENQFKYRDSIIIIRKQVESYEQLVKEQAEKIERVRLNVKEAEKLQKEVNRVKRK